MILAIDPGSGGKGRSDIGWAINVGGRVVAAGSCQSRHELWEIGMDIKVAAGWLVPAFSQVIVESPGGVGIAQRRTSYRAREVLAEVRGYAHACADFWDAAYQEVEFGVWSDAICGAPNMPALERAVIIRLRLLADGMSPGTIARLDGHALDACGIAMWAAATRRIEAAVKEGT